MARNRMIKPEFWASETLMRASRDSRLLFIGLWNFCDDYGFCMGSNRRVLGDVFPVDDNVTEANIKKWITELITVNVVIPLEYKGKKLLFIKSWGEHQTVQHKSKRSFIEPTDLEHIIKETLDSHEELISNYLDSHAPKRKLKKKEKEESNKDKHLDCVYLNTLEFDKLISSYGTKSNLDIAISFLNNYKMSNNKQYDSDYHVVVGWMFQKFEKDLKPIYQEQPGFSR